MLLNLSRLVLIIKMGQYKTTFNGLGKTSPMKYVAKKPGSQPMIINIIISITASGPTQGGKETKVIP